MRSATKDSGGKVTVAALGAAKRNRNINAKRGRKILHRHGLRSHREPTGIVIAVENRRKLRTIAVSHGRPKQRTQQQDEDVIGKAYDSRLMRRLLIYLRPYQVAGRRLAGSDPFQAFADVLGSVPDQGCCRSVHDAVGTDEHSCWTRHLSHNPITGITQIAGIYLARWCLFMCWHSSRRT